MNVLLYQGGVKDPEIRAASVATLNDSDPISVAALFWTQIGWIWALAVSGRFWILGFSLLDMMLFVSRWRIRRGRDLRGRPVNGTSEILFTTINLGLIALVSICVLVLTQAGSDRASVLGIILAVGFSGYAAALFTAFPVLASVNIGMLYAALGGGLAFGSSDLARPFALLAPCAALAFWLLTQQTHRTLLQAIRSQLDNHRLSLRDPLTALPNRSDMRDRLARLLASIGTGEGPRAVAILCLDLDGFKSINDSHGHAAGDGVLIHVADLLRRLMAPGDFACRMGGDEYVVVLPGADEARARSVGAAIIDAVCEPFEVGRTSPARIGV
jgi:diguanylate cyclase (GGDEF)-like protein